MVTIGERILSILGDSQIRTPGLLAWLVYGYSDTSAVRCIYVHVYRLRKRGYGIVYVRNRAARGYGLLTTTVEDGNAT